MIHPTAIVDPRAELDSSVDVGPYAVIEAGVVVGPQCRIGPFVHLSGLTRIGSGNVFHPGCVVGNIPQDLKYRGAPSRLEVGDRNTFRENVTVNRATDEGHHTVVGSDNLLMAGSHVGHDVELGNHILLANGALLGGHVVVEDRAIVSGNCCVHQFVRIGTLAMMQGGSAISQDLPPFCMARGDNTICGLNIIGLRRAGVSSEERLELRRLYLFLFRGDLPLRAAVEQARPRFTRPSAARFIEFVAAARRGVCADIARSRPSRPDREPTGEDE